MEALKMERTNINRIRKQFGQGMVEYMSVVALVAIAAIGTYSAFGHTVRSQMAAVANGLAGDSSSAKTAIADAKTTANTAATSAKTAQGLNNFDTGVTAK
jgi:pilus assembly protein Flp/PilA